ncbi:TIGR01457 family HAD-type hydrolase [Halalkalibacterium halodurans]|uniref:TIGR01457 family HAD-type hydrolase n=1 Tax=Halalkalibacterium halodurans TaxID=86665 RepID=UPI002E214029|nr:TIGR01457 family HAD-type hydrolase [Halalkalibacterium halodurans]MED4083341.1 TIGR01457 family HAD-type hydrolase [Halalkalibacterium halodurans]MED4105083.1 TIGR01457 family HAD-type hydrolase [Halalkalibacterium halodurans]MED4109401.1 TIGR01457 family HAD-type hydrolase [Halalkalibacterium halodurans]MED4124209.1 TIGR01457 family HAD-type hydrolase [Halalkalibacterium halodurans]
MKRYSGFLIDLDGTMYRGSEVITEAVAFVKQLEKQSASYLFVTNNSTKSPETVATLLKSMDVPATKEHVFTSSMAMASYLTRTKEFVRAFVIGEEGLLESLKESGMMVSEDEQPDYVVMGLDRAISYEKLAKAATYVRQGAKFFITNGDAALPTEKGLMPGNGSLAAVVATTTGVKPFVVGKPSPIIIEEALKRLGSTKEETLLIGDNYDTDILAGIHAGIDTLLVHTGVTTKEALKQKEAQPTYTCESLADWQRSIEE